MSFSDLRVAGNLRLLYLYANPWHCTCNVRWLHEWVDKGLITYDMGSSNDDKVDCGIGRGEKLEEWKVSVGCFSVCVRHLGDHPLTGRPEGDGRLQGVIHGGGLCVTLITIHS
jgi:hypothetical protein